MTINHGWTSHGYPCCAHATVGDRPITSPHRCGGTRMCKHCQQQRDEIHAPAESTAAPRSFVSRTHRPVLKAGDGRRFCPVCEVLWPCGAARSSSLVARMVAAQEMPSVEDRVRAIHPGWDDARVAAEVTLVTAAAKSAPPTRTDAEGLARRFHETYERLAPSHGYKTRKASAVPWSDVPANNKSLMIAVCSELLGAMLAESRLVVSQEIADALQERSGVRPSSWAAAAEVARQIGGVA